MAQIATGRRHAASLGRRVGHLVSVNLGVEQKKRLLHRLAVGALDGCQEPLLELDVPRVQTERVGRIGQLCEEAHESDQALALLQRILTLPGQAPQLICDLVGDSL